jgi:hypothetical protein
MNGQFGVLSLGPSNCKRALTMGGSHLVVLA